MSKTLFRITTIPLAFKALIAGQPKFMREHGYTVILVSADGPERQSVMDYEGCEHIIIPMTRKITPLQDFRCYLKLVRLFKKYRPNIVHTHTPKAGLLGMMAAKTVGVKIRIHTIAGLPVLIEKGLKRQVLLLTDRITYASATNIWPNSPSSERHIIEKGRVQKSKVTLINKGSSNGVDLKKYSFSSLDLAILESVKKRILNGKFKILFVGRIVKDKGIRELVGAFERLRVKYDVTLTLLGPYENELDPLDDVTLQIIRANPAILHIEWSDDVEYYMAASDVLAHPSHREGFPNVLLEAGAMKLPVICSGIPGNLDIIEDSSFGSIFPVEDAESLYNSLSFAIENPDKTRQRAEKLYGQVISSFSREVVQKAILEQYSLLENQ